MEIAKNNIYKTLQEVSYEAEVFESIIETENIFVEKISTIRAYEKPGRWVEQEKDEWVLLMQGKAILEFDNKGEVNLEKGDYILIPAQTKHRVVSTSTDPKCIWLAIHGKLK